MSYAEMSRFPGFVNAPPGGPGRGRPGGAGWEPQAGDGNLGILRSPAARWRAGPARGPLGPEATEMASGPWVAHRPGTPPGAARADGRRGRRRAGRE